MWLGRDESQSWLQIINKSSIKIWDSVSSDRTVCCVSGLTLTGLSMAFETLERFGLTPYLVAVSRTLRSFFPFSSFLKLGIKPAKTRKAAEKKLYTIPRFHMGETLTPERNVGFYYDDSLEANGLLIISKEEIYSRVIVEKK